MEVNGVDLYCREEGAGPPVLLIHGAGVDADTWGEAITDLARNHRVIAYDRRGYTRSKVPPVKDYAQHAEDAATLMRELDAAPATVVGWSSGGLIALDLTVGHPDLVSSLVLLEPTLYGRKHVGPSLAGAFLKTQVLRRRKGDRAAADHWFRWVTGYRSGGSTWDRDDYPDEAREQMLANASVSMVEMDARDSPNLSKARLRSITCPVTCVVGDLSRPWFHKTAREVMKLLPQANLQTIEGSNHAFGFEQPHELARVVEEASLKTAAAVG
jgi:pimeloyl-ACP methyl ester carboxylesterase